MTVRENRCSFCGKKQSEIRLIAGPGVFICSQCVALCNEILSHDLPPGEARSPEQRRPEPPEQPSPRGPLTRIEVTSS